MEIPKLDSSHWERPRAGHGDPIGPRDAPWTQARWADGSMAPWALWADWPQGPAPQGPGAHVPGAQGSPEVRFMAPPWVPIGPHG